jgi:hypothetical protein
MNIMKFQLIMKNFLRMKIFLSNISILRTYIYKKKWTNYKIVICFNNPQCLIIKLIPLLILWYNLISRDLKYLKQIQRKMKKIKKDSLPCGLIINYLMKIIHFMIYKRKMIKKNLLIYRFKIFYHDKRLTKKYI